MVSGYHSRSISETAMSLYKKLINPTLTLRGYDAQVVESFAGIRALNKLMRVALILFDNIARIQLRSATLSNIKQPLPFL
ncbi:hypothetical protein VCRA2133E348_250001 [Vibrio crassostreae]|nr:hypothetical protein VCRA2119O48_220001 [Vibrio crassostreae]CAK2803087.1 hypothetical protein VCRA2133E348_250001 [Vibrio crassostreae]CAK3293174.1 hypothetical protein VCRA213O314_240093 [Vibrio crassostreae]CAK3846396.1 hypothetical protein VCRA212O16_230001 [Vibrio crassostreae]